MRLLYFLGSLCHLTTVWSQQKSTIFAFQQFSPTVSLWRVWKCDQCGVYQFAPRKKNGTNWPFGSSADWRRGPLQRAVGVHCCRRVRVMMDGREGDGLGKGAGPKGCGSGLISSQRSHQSAKNGPISVNPKWNVWGGGKVPPVPDSPHYSSRISFLLIGWGHCTIQFPVCLFIPLQGYNLSF